MDESKLRHPVERLRDWLTRTERLLAQEATSGALQGASESLRQQLPAAILPLRSLLEEAATSLGQTAQEALRGDGGLPGEVAQKMSAASVRGALDELERHYGESSASGDGLVARLNHLADSLVGLAQTQHRQLQESPQNVRKTTAESVAGAADALEQRLPSRQETLMLLLPLAHEVGLGIGRGISQQLAADLDVQARAVAARTSRGVVDGLVEALGEHARILRARFENFRRQAPSPLMSVGGALGGLVLLGVLRR